MSKLNKLITTFIIANMVITPFTVRADGWERTVNKVGENIVYSAYKTDPKINQTMNFQLMTGHCDKFGVTVTESNANVKDSYQPVVCSIEIDEEKINEGVCNFITMKSQHTIGITTRPEMAIDIRKVIKAKTLSMTVPNKKWRFKYDIQGLYSQLKKFKTPCEYKF